MAHSLAGERLQLRVRVMSRTHRRSRHPAESGGYVTRCSAGGDDDCTFTGITPTFRVDFSHFANRYQVDQAPEYR